jgi:hypothetical protein
MDFLNKKYTVTKQSTVDDTEWICRVPWKESNKLGMRESPSNMQNRVVNHGDSLRVFFSDDWRLHYDCFNPLENWMMTYNLFDENKEAHFIDNFYAEPMGIYIKSKTLRVLGYEVGDSLNMTYHPDTINNERYLKIWRKE